LFHICLDFFVSSHGNASVGIWQLRIACLFA
jgi:hypothetical protein